MSTTILFAAISVHLLCSIVTLTALYLLARRSIAAAVAKEDHDTAAPQPPILPGKSATWHAVPGNRIELAGTGFAIASNADANRSWYTLYTPEGMRMAELNDLPTMKQCAERFAAEREEFIYRGLPPQKAQA